MDENNRENEQEDPQPLTDEELAELQRKQKRTGGIIGTIIDFLLGFFH